MLFLKSSQLSGTGIKTPKSGQKNIYKENIQATRRQKSKKYVSFFSKEKSPSCFTVLGLFVLFGTTPQLHVLLLFYEMASVNDMSNKSDQRLVLK